MKISPYAFALVSTTLLATPAVADPPPNANPEYNSFFHSLKTKDGGDCCAEADCRQVQTKQDAQFNWSALIDKKTFGSEGSNKYEPVERGQVQQRCDSPFDAVACWDRYNFKIRCFVLKSSCTTRLPNYGGSVQACFRPKGNYNPGLTLGPHKKM